MMMDEAIDPLIGNATTGQMVELKNAYTALDYRLEHNQVAPMQRDAAHELMEGIQAWLTSGGTFPEGATDTVGGYITACGSY